LQILIKAKGPRSNIACRTFYLARKKIRAVQEFEFFSLDSRLFLGFFGYGVSLESLKISCRGSSTIYTHKCIHTPIYPRI